jgi:hypothetical protein
MFQRFRLPLCFNVSAAADAAASVSIAIAIIVLACRCSTLVVVEEHHDQVGGVYFRLYFSILLDILFN